MTASTAATQYRTFSLTGGAFSRLAHKRLVRVLGEAACL